MTDQQLSILRWALVLIGGWLANRGLVSNSDLTVLEAAVLGIAGPAVALGMAVWGWYTHSRAAQVAAVAAMPPEQRLPQLSPKALITAVNNDPTNGAMVVADTENVPRITAPIIPPIAKPTA